MHDVRLYSVLDTVVIFGEDVCCSVVFGTLVRVFVFSVVRVADDICYLLFSVVISVQLCQRMECAFTSPMRIECGMFVLYGVVYVHISCFVVRGCWI